jgi:hypothetical protein
MSTDKLWFMGSCYAENREFPEYTHRSLKNLLIGTSLCQMRGANLQ